MPELEGQLEGSMIIYNYDGCIYYIINGMIYDGDTRVVDNDNEEFYKQFHLTAKPISETSDTLCDICVHKFPRIKKLFDKVEFYKEVLE
jgi:hypothetical protein